MEPDGYRETSRALLAKGRDELEKGDRLQASEKLWGAAAHIAKAIAARRGWRHDSHAHLFEVVNRLARETQDDELRGLFAFAGHLHTNFYENWYPREFIEDGARAVEEFVRRLDRL